MTFVFIILVLVAVISVFQFRDAKERWNITEMASRALNPKYGVHQIQKYQSLIFIVILSILFVVMLLMVMVYDNLTFVSHVIDTTNSNKIDSMARVYNLPPPEEKEKTIEITHFAYPGMEGYAAVNQVAQEEAHKSEGVKYDSPTQQPNRTTHSAEDDVYAFEQQLFAETGGAQKRAELEKQREEIQQKKQAFEQQKREQQIKAGSANAAVPKGGKTMVSYSLSGRKPHNNNMYYVRNPGYTCEQGSYGEVVVNIKVDQLGNVVSATPSQSYSSLNPCLVEQAVKYAKLSRFDGSSNASQSGTITYQFVP